MAALKVFFHGRAWPLAAGMAVAGVVALLFGPLALALVIGLTIAAVIFLGQPETSPASARPEDPQPLSPLVRGVIEQLPAPVLLLDESKRVILVNSAMRPLVGADAEGRHVSAVLRNPAVLTAIDQTADDGEPATVQFTLPVPIERHYEAYVVRVGDNPPATVLMLHDLTAIRRSELGERHARRRQRRPATS